MVSVIIPYFNRGDTLPRALDSVCNQTYEDFEIILVNDGSTDQCDQLVEEYIKKHPEIRFKHIYQTNTGPSGARNNGILNAEGEYIAFLDSDDSWEKENLETQIKYLENNSNIALTGTNFYVIKDGKRSRYPLEPAVLEAEYYRMLFKIFFCVTSSVVRREVFYDDNIWFRVGKHQGEDQLLFLQILRKHRGVRFSKPLANIYKLEYGEEGLTSDLSKLLATDLDNLRILYSENRQSTKKIAYTLFFVLNLYTYLKHVKRVLRSNWYQWKAKKRLS